ncbi:SusC/RagA family TonB-linked outer membrane protein [Sphingobacterium sp. Ag1]|uniref:SusC/RagA family TonB-linked outer membrane protein n=1 Tax=Sphingobacterium sp. Ag1 TaxID=1643451 RepID=UPI00069C0120|nr:TonB-dependent receptor [Sphingobacterium sp. Ag1]
MNTKKTRQWPEKRVSFVPEVSIMALCLSIAVPTAGSAKSLWTTAGRLPENTPHAAYNKLGMFQHAVKGKVKDSDGKPIEGVTVKVKNSAVETKTNGLGDYEFKSVDVGAVLLFSSVGFETREVVFNGNGQQLDVVLNNSSSSLEEVVVVGYGTQKKVNLTGAVATVSGKDMIKRPVVNTASMLQGAIPGVQINQGSGEPGNEGVSIRIRGKGTFSGAGSDPLVLIDGVQGKFSDVNPNDIENVSVLKDAASAAIYGSRAANGVILITTKQGKSGKTTVQYDGNVGIYKPTKMFDLITNSAQYMELYNEARKNSNLNDGLYPADVIAAYRNSNDPVKYPNTDWLGLIFQTKPTYTHNLGIQGGNEKTTFNVGLGYVNQDGMIKGFNYDRYSARLNLTTKISDGIKFGTNILLKTGHTESIPGGSKDLFLSAMSQAPTYGPFLPDGSGRYTYKAYDWEYNNKNPMAVLDRKFTYNTDDYAANLQAWMEVQLFKGLSWYTKGAYNFNMDKYKDYKSTLDEYYYHTGTLGTTLDLGKGLTDQDQQTIYTNLFTYLNYDRAFGAHHLKAQAGYSIEKSKYTYLQGFRQNFVDDTLTELNAGGSDIQRANGTANQWALISYFGRLNYDYQGKYLLEANMRYDGSSKFYGKNRWAVFPSFSAGWRVSEESFVKEFASGWLDNLKIRGSWGQLGNQNTGNYPYQPVLGLTGNYSFDNSTLNSGVAQQGLNNPIIKWETTTMTDVGLDLSLFKNLDITFDWYKKRTTDILRQSQITAIVGLGAPYVNDGIVENKGLELGITYRSQITTGALEGLRYQLGANLDRFKNKLVKFGEPEIGGYTVKKNGYAMDSFYTYEVMGIFQSEQEVASSPKQFNDNTLPGDLKYRDVNGDGKIDANDRTIIAGVDPKLNYSFNLSASFKGFDFSALLQGVYGVKSYVSGWGVTPFVQGSPPTKDWLDRWTPENPSTTMPRIYWGWSAPEKFSRASSYFIQDASYFRLKNLVLGYTLPDGLLKKYKIDRLRVYFSGDNLVTATKFKGLDPERYGNGDLVQYPQNKIYSFGVQVNF